MSSVMLMPLDRMRVGINSESASQTQTPGPTAKKAMKTNRQPAVSQPLSAEGTGVMSAFSILNGAVRAASRLAKGFEKKAMTLFAGTQLVRASSMGSVVASERVAGVAALKPP